MAGVASCEQRAQEPADEQRPRSDRPSAQRPGSYKQGSAPVGPNDEADREWAELNRSIVLPTDDKHRKLARSPAWLASYWVDHKAACRGSDSGIFLYGDGRYSDYGTGGRYTLSGEAIRMVTTEVYNTGSADDKVGDRDESGLKLIGPNEIELSDWRDEAGNRLRLYRCPPEPIDQ